MSSDGMLWVSRDPAASQETIEAAAREFKLTVGFCSPDEALEHLRGLRCDLVGVEFGVDPRASLALLKELRARLPRATLLAASGDESVAVMRAALEAGASDVLTAPVDRHEFHKALIKFTQVRTAKGGGRGVVGDVITVCGARGGLGVTTVAVNLAVRLVALTGSEAALVDLDLQRGDVSAFLNLTPLQSIAALANARSEVDDIFLHGTLTRHPSGVFVLPAPQQIEEADAVSHDDVEGALRLLRAQFRYTVVDMARTITTPTLAALEQGDRILVLTDLSVPGVRAARRMVELLDRLGTPAERVELVVTQAVPGPLDVKEATRAIGRRPMVVIPRDADAAGRAMNSGTPLNGTRQAGLSLAIGELAAKLTGLTPSPARTGGLLKRLFAKETTA